jgi:hypothetical protein
MLLETSLYQTPFAGKLDRDSVHSGDLYFSWEGGAMANTSPRDAWGASIYIASDLSSTRLGIMPRYRRWLPHSLAVDFSGGPFLIDTHQEAPSRIPGFMARGALHFSDLIAITPQLDMMRRESVWEGRAMVGLRVGSYPAIPMFLINMALESSFDEPRTYIGF